MRHCKAMEQDLAHCDRLPPGHEEKSYDYCSAARALLEHSRLRWFRGELCRSIGGGWVNAADKGGDDNKDRKKAATAKAETERNETRTIPVYAKLKPT